MMTEYKTLSYKDKMEQQYNKKIDTLLSQMPSFCEAYELYARSRNNTKTRMEYLSDIFNFFRYLSTQNRKFEDISSISVSDLEKLNGFDFDGYLSWLGHYRFDKNDHGEDFKENSAVSKKRKMMAVKSLFHFLYVREYISCNPTEKAIIPKVQRKKRSKISVLEDKECQKFIDAINKAYDDAIEVIESKPKGKATKRELMRPYIALRDKAIVYLILGTGLRVSELCAINCADIVEDLGFINVIRKGDGTDGGDDTSDKVYLSIEVISVLFDYIENARDNIGADENNYDALFVSSKHQRMTPRAVELMVKEYADRALGTNNNVHPHTLRATFGTRYYRMTRDISATSTAMNHSGIEVTARYYLREDEEAKQKAAMMRILGN